MSSAYLFYICRKNSHVRNPTVWFINRQYVSAFCRRGCVWNHPSQPEAVEKETLPLCLLLYADHRQRCFTRGFLVLFFFFLEIFVFPLARKGEKETSSRAVSWPVLLLQDMSVFASVSTSVWTITWNLQAVMLLHPLSSQVEGWHGHREPRPVWEFRRPRLMICGSLLSCIADGSPHLDPGLKTSCTWSRKKKIKEASFLAVIFELWWSFKLK